MGQALAEAFPAAREVFQEVDDALGRKLSRLMREGPMEELTLTANTQPALMAHSIAMLRVLHKEAGLDIENAMFVAGHSLGEYSALCAAGALSLADTARLLRTRGEAMQAAVPPGEGAMAALIGADLDTAQKAIDASAGEGVCEIANDNAPGQVVISGAKARVEAVCVGAKAFGIKMAKLLPVSAPFHSSLMAPAAGAMAAALEKATVRAPSPPLVANVIAREVVSPAEIRDLLVKQVTGRVRWRESALAMAGAGVSHFVEFGGKVVGPMIKRSAGDAVISTLVDMADIEALAKEI